MTLHFTLDEIPAASPELIWELPAELKPIAATSAQSSRPLLDDL
ncbi:hypothetical protein [Pseudomonas sp. TMB3-21]